MGSVAGVMVEAAGGERGVVCSQELPRIRASGHHLYAAQRDEIVAALGGRSRSACIGTVDAFQGEFDVVVMSCAMPARCRCRIRMPKCA